MKTLLALSALSSTITPYTSVIAQSHARETSNTKATRVDQSYLTDEGKYSDIRYIFKGIETIEAHYFDIFKSHQEGEIDPISYRARNERFSKTFVYTNRVYGWDDKPKTNQFAKKYKITYEDLVSREEQWFYVYINVARGATNPVDYAFAALIPGDIYKIHNYHVQRSLNTGRKAAGADILGPTIPSGYRPFIDVPQMFGVNISFFDMIKNKIYDPKSTGFGISSDYIVAGTMNSATKEIYNGDYFSKFPSLNNHNIDPSSHIGIQGNGLLKDFIYNVSLYAYTMLNKYHTDDNEAHTPTTPTK